jgi:large subunit ribosomal protein L5
MQEMRERSLMAPRLKEQYNDEIRDQVRKDLDLGNVMQVPRLSKIVVNMGAGDAAADSKLINGVVEDLRIITGQQPRVNRARKSVSNFKIREGQPIGASVTLRGERMWEFLDRLIALAIPRIRDFRGLSPKGFDGRGNYSFGVTEQLIFPEIDYDKVMKVRGMDITLVTTAETDEQGLALLDAFGFPFRKQQVGA